MIFAESGAVAKHFYFDREFGRKAVKLLPAEYYVTNENTVLTTVLGSCVAACLLDVKAGVAGMNHFMLPEEGVWSERSQGELGSMRYGTYAMEILIRDMVNAGARRERLQAKVFGGAAVLANMTTLNIGDRNADLILRFMKGKGISIAAQDLRGKYPRRVMFFPDTGKVMVRRLQNKVGIQFVQHTEGNLFQQLIAPEALVNSRFDMPDGKMNALKTRREI